LNKFFGDRVTWHDANKLLGDNENQQVKKWITLYFSIYFRKVPNDREGIEKIAIDITSIINNTHSLFTENGDFLGCVNPYLRIDTIFSESGERPHLKMDLEKIFKCSIREYQDQYQLIIHPTKENSEEIDLYSLENLCYDMYILGHASDFIANRYQIKVHTIESTFNPEIMSDIPGYGKNVPFISHFTRLLVYRYPVKERFEFQKQKPILDTWLFGGGSMTFSHQIDTIRRNQPNSEWTEKVSEIIGDLKK
jgi:hypothetical protein